VVGRHDHDDFLGADAQAVEADAQTLDPGEGLARRKVVGGVGRIDPYWVLRWFLAGGIEIGEEVDFGHVKRREGRLESHVEYAVWG